MIYVQIKYFAIIEIIHYKSSMLIKLHPVHIGIMQWLRLGQSELMNKTISGNFTQEESETGSKEEILVLHRLLNPVNEE